MTTMKYSLERLNRCGDWITVEYFDNVSDANRSARMTRAIFPAAYRVRQITIRWHEEVSKAT